MRLCLSLLALAQLFAIVRCQCKFTAKQIEEETRLVATGKQGHVELLHQDTVTTGSVVYFICNDKDVSIAYCNLNKQFSVTVPVNQCKNPPKAIVAPSKDSTCKAMTYRVGYKFQGKFLELYRTCYDKSSLRTKFTTHVAYPYSLATKRPSASFTLDGVLTVKEAASFQTKNIYANFKTLLGSDQTYITSVTDVVINRGHMTPSGDYLFPANKRATFKYINVIPQFGSINGGNWKSIENWTRNYINSTGMACRIVTGAFGTLALGNKLGKNVPIFLENNKRNPVPLWIYKIVENRRGTFVFLTYNNIYETVRPKSPCKTIDCPLKLENRGESGFTYCCEPNDFKFNKLPHVR